MKIWFLQIQFSSKTLNWSWVCRFDFSNLILPLKQNSSSEWKMDFLNPFTILCPFFLPQEKWNLFVNFIKTKTRLPSHPLILTLHLTNFLFVYASFWLVVKHYLMQQKTLVPQTCGLTFIFQNVYGHFFLSWPLECSSFLI